MNDNNGRIKMASVTIKIMALVFLVAILRKKSYPDESLPFDSTTADDAWLLSTTFMATLLFLWVMLKISSKIFWWAVKRYCNSTCPERALQHFIRDSGLFHTLMAVMSLKNAKEMISVHPSVLWHSLRLAWNKEVFAYGYQSASQYVELFLPPAVTAKNNEKQQYQQVDGVLVFVHGGAWGSGDPSMYRLLALPFERMNWAIAIVGYRTYPEGDASTQIQDLEKATNELKKRYPHLCHNVCLMGHSSGAHIAMLTLVERVRRKMELERTGDTMAMQQWSNSLLAIDSFIGVSGPYNILNHFDFEADRGVEQISPMKPACGNSRKMFLRYSPAVQVSRMAAEYSSPKERDIFIQAFPQMTLVHGMLDDTVPISSTKEVARVLKASGLRQCNEIYERDTGHEAAIMQVMIGGPVQGIVTDFLKKQ